MDYDHARTDISQGNMKGWWGKGQGGKGLRAELDGTKLLEDKPGGRVFS